MLLPPKPESGEALFRPPGMGRNEKWHMIDKRKKLRFVLNAARNASTKCPQRINESRSQLVLKLTEEVMVQFFSANTIVRKHINPHPLFSWKSGSWLTEKYWFQMNLYQQQRHYVGWQAAKKNRLQLILIVHKKYLESKNVRYLVTVKLNDGTFIHLISEFSQIICS